MIISLIQILILNQSQNVFLSWVKDGIIVPRQVERSGSSIRGSYPH